jgi:prefoldin subunit 5
MKLQTVFLSVLLLFSFFGGFPNVNAYPTLVPHEDPSATQSSVDAYALLTEYAAVFSFMSNRNFQNASLLSNKLGQLTVPSDLSYIINRYNQLTQQLISTLNELQTDLDNATVLLRQNSLDRVEQILNHAGVLIAQAEILLEDLKEATLTIGQRLGIASASNAQQAYTKLQEMLQKLKELIDQYYKLLQEVKQKANDLKSKNLDPTTVTLTVNTSKCFVGDYITASGTLTAKSYAIENRRVKLFLDGKQVATANTNHNGAYTVTIQIPYKYVNQIQLKAEYNPESNDQNKYLASTSSTVKVQVLFYRTSLAVSVSDLAYPGLPLSISGKVTDQEGTPLAERQISVYLGDKLEGQVKSSLNGTFNSQFTLDPQITTGNYTLKITTQASYRYAPAEVQRTLTVTKMATAITVNSPTFIVIPTELQITGTVSSAASALKGAVVELYFTNKTAKTVTLNDGSFNLTVNVALDAAFGGYQELTLKTQPAQPWQAATQTKISIFTVNSAGTSIAFALSLCVFTVAFLKFSKTKKNTLSANADTPIIPDPKPMQKQYSTTSIASTQETKFEGERGKILKAYVEAQTVVHGATGNILTANMTLREYAVISKSRIGEAAQAFAELTGLSEKALYSPHTPQPQEAENAEDLSETVRRILFAATS